MAQITDDDLDQQSFGQMLMPQEQQQQAPAPDAGMASVLMGQASDPHEPSMFEKGRNFAQSNPMAAQMLLSTFMRMAQGGGSSLADTVGQGVASGAQAGMMYMAQGKQDQEKAQKEKLALDKEEKDRALRERQMQIQEGEFGLKKEDAPINRAQKQAQTKEIQTRTSTAAAQAPLQLESIKAKIAQIQQSIANDKDGLKTNGLRRQLIGLQIAKESFEHDLDKEYGDAERNAKATGLQLQNQGKSAQNEALQRENEDLSKLTPEQRLARGQGTGKAPKSEEDQFIEFVNKNADLFLDQQGNLDTARARKSWADLRTTPQQAQANNADMQAKMQAARSAVKVGEVYQGPDGKLYKRKN